MLNSTVTESNSPGTPHTSSQHRAFSRRDPGMPLGSGMGSERLRASAMVSFHGGGEGKDGNGHIAVNLRARCAAGKVESAGLVEDRGGG